MRWLCYGCGGGNDKKDKPISKIILSLCSKGNSFFLRLSMASLMVMEAEIAVSLTKTPNFSLERIIPGKRKDKNKRMINQEEEKKKKKKNHS